MTSLVFYNMALMIIQSAQIRWQLHVLIMMTSLNPFIPWAKLILRRWRECTTAEVIQEALFQLPLTHCVKSVRIWSFFWSVISPIQTKYGDLLYKYSYSVQIWKNPDLKNFGLFSRRDSLSIKNKNFEKFIDDVDVALVP